MDYILNVVSVDSLTVLVSFWVCCEISQAVKQYSFPNSLTHVWCTCFPDEVCGIYTKQQHNRWPLSGICEPEGAATSGFYSGPAQLAHRLSHLCCLPSCCRCLQVHIGEHKRMIPVIFLFIVFIYQEWHTLMRIWYWSPRFSQKTRFNRQSLGLIGERNISLLNLDWSMFSPNFSPLDSFTWA